MSSLAHLLVFDGFADWEPALAIAELRRSGGVDILVVGFTKEPVTSMGGMPIVPHIPLGEVHPETVRLFLVPGGDMWEDERAYPSADLTKLLRELDERGIPVAGICAGTIALARAGLLDARAHTSNFRGYLSKNAPGYRGGERYADALAVRDARVVTASGLGYVEFAREIMAELDVLTAEERDRWFHVFKTGEWVPPGEA